MKKNTLLILITAFYIACFIGVMSLLNEKNLQINTIIVKSSGMDFVKTIINENEDNNPKISTNSKYEL